MQGIGKPGKEINYSAFIFLVPVVSVFGHYIAPNQPIFKGHDWGIISAYLLIFLATVAWIPLKWNFSWSRLQLLFFMVALMLWIYQTVRTQLDQSLFNISAFIFPYALFLIFTKRPSSNQIRLAFLVMLYGLLAISFLSLILGATGVASDGFDGIDSAESRIPILSDLTGIDTRWAGPFGSVNYASPAGGLIVIGGLIFHGRNRVLLCMGGALIMVLAQSRTSIVALLIGLIVYLLFSAALNRSPHKALLRTSIAAVAACTLLIYVLLIDPSLNGRTPIWGGFFELFQNEPLFGVGFSGIQDYITLNLLEPGFVPHNHAHSVYFDIATRYGIVPFILTLLLLSLSIFVGWRTRNEDRGTQLALGIYVVFAGVAETIYSWQYLSIYFAALLSISLSSNLKSKSENTSLTYVVKTIPQEPQS
jgi:O-antigen ligase